MKFSDRTFDIECLALAKHILDMPPRNAVEDAVDLAQHIQTAVNGWLYLSAQYPGVRPNDIVACDEAKP